MTPRVETERLILVPLAADDATELVDVLSDPSLYSFTGDGPPTLDVLGRRYRGWVAGASRPGEAWHNWVIRLAADRTAVGHLQATVFDAARADIAWTVGTPWQGRGYATEAARALVDWLDSTGVKTVSANIHPRNLASARVAERAGLAPTDDVIDGEVVWRRAGEPSCR